MTQLIERAEIKVGERWISKRTGTKADLVAVQLLCVAEFGITNEHFHAPLKPKQVSDCRYCYCWIMSRIYGMSYSSIGRYLSNRHHTSIRSRCLIMDVWIERQYPILDNLNRIIDQL